jgi:hypothetical protein
MRRVLAPLTLAVLLQRDPGQGMERALAAAGTAATISARVLALTVPSRAIRMAALTLVTMAGCSGGTSAPAGGEPPQTIAAADEPSQTIAVADEPSPTVACDLPWESMAQVAVCQSDDYVVASTEGVEVHVVIRSKDPDAIAAALAGAFLDNRGNAEQLIVWAYSDATLVGTGYDRGVVSEEGTLGEGLVFEVCTSWDESEGIICADREVFSVTQ